MAAMLASAKTSIERLTQKEVRHHRIYQYTRAFVVVVLLLLCGCVAKPRDVVYISVPDYVGEDSISTCEILCQVDCSEGALQWSKSFDAEQLLCCTDADTVYVGYGTNEGTICALHPETGEVLWQTNCALSWAVGSSMQLSGGKLYYPGNYDPSAQEYPLYTLDVNTLEETRLPVGHMQHTSFSVYQGCIYTYGANGVLSYHLENGQVFYYELQDPEYLFINFCENHMVVAYENRVEWYTINPSGLEQTKVISAEDMGMEQITVCAATPSAFVFLTRPVGEQWTETDFCAVTLEQGNPVVCDRVTSAPSDVVFTEEGFYASWEARVVYHDWAGNQRTIWTK